MEDFLSTPKYKTIYKSQSQTWLREKDISKQKSKTNYTYFYGFQITII